MLRGTKSCIISPWLESFEYNVDRSPVRANSGSGKPGACFGFQLFPNFFFLFFRSIREKFNFPLKLRRVKWARQVLFRWVPISDQFARSLFRSAPFPPCHTNSLRHPMPLYPYSLFYRAHYCGEMSTNGQCAG